MAELTVPQIDFSALGQLPQVYKAAQADQLRQQTLASLGQGGTADASALLKSGDLSLANLGIQMQNRQSDQARQAAQDAFQREESARAQRNADRSFGLQARAANRADEDKYIVKEITDPNSGAITLVRVKITGGEGPINVGMPAAASPNNPFSAGGKFNGDQGKAAGFTDRMLQSEGVLSGVAPEGGIGPVAGIEAQGANITQNGLSKIPGIGNYLVSNDQQKYSQAKSDFINAQLRRESGAAIGASEFANADRQYFPLPGDKPEVIAQKNANRRAAIEAMGREGGGSYKPKTAYREDGTLAPYGRPAVTTQSAPADIGQPANPATFRAPPKMGELRDGYRFKGGNPGDPNSWVKAQ